MGLSVQLYDYPYYRGGGVSSMVPNIYTVSLNGRPYMVDFNQPFYRQYRRQITPLLRTQADVGTQPGEQSLNPDDLWRRAQEDWSLGAGQRYLDRKDSLANRFWQSKGIDVWTKWQMGLLPDTRQSRTSANANVACVSVGAYLYIADGTTLAYTQDITVASPVFTTVTGTPNVTITSICSDGFNVWIACGASGVYTTTAGAAAATQYVTTALDATAIVAFLKGRLMVAWKNALYNVVATGALPAALFTHANTNFKWVGFAEGQGQLYAAGWSGDRSWIYGTAVLSDGTALAAPAVRGELPAGEQITSIFGYLGFLVVGSILGVRFASTDGSGNVTLLALIPTPAGVYCAVGSGRFMWFGWTNYDSASTGLGRMDLQNFAIPGIQPAYASDLMVPAQGQVNAVATFQGIRIFAVAGSGFWAQHTGQLVASGTLDSGYILFGLPDPKVGILMAVQSPVPLPAGQYKSFVSADMGPFNQVGVHAPANPDPVVFPINQVSAQRFEVRTELDRDGSQLLVSPTISRYTLRVFPAPKRPLTWQLPLILDQSIVNASSSTDGFDPLYELQQLEQMASAGRLVTFQEGLSSYAVFVSDVEFLPDYTTEGMHFFNGVALVTLKGLPIT